jgi:hypothetical protein
MLNIAVCAKYETRDLKHSWILISAVVLTEHTNVRESQETQCVGVLSGKNLHT